MRALITGITGQDGYYLSKLLLSKGYEVWGTARSSVSSRSRDDVDPRITFLSADLRDFGSIKEAIGTCEPDEIYNLGAQSHVGLSFKQAEHTMDVVGLGPVRVMDAALQLGLKDVRIYQASSSEMFGNSPPPQNEETPFDPRSPYAVAKVAAHRAAKVYRDSYGLHVSCGILFNHESERRPPSFVTRKISVEVARIGRALAAGRNPAPMRLGNLDAKRDWGYAPEYVEAMWMMLQQPKPDDYVIATGETHTVGDFVQEAFRCIGVDNWSDYTVTDDKYLRPNEVHMLRGDANKAKAELGWRPHVTFHQLVERMIENDRH